MAIIPSKTPLRKRPRHDHYQTPLEVAISACELLVAAYNLPEKALILDAGAGSGVWGYAIRSVLPDCALVGVEIDPRFQRVAPYLIWHQADFLKWDGRKWGFRPFDLVIGNPPFKHADQFVRQAHQHLKAGGYVFFLLKLAFLASLRRGKPPDGLFSVYPPIELWFSMRRISFYKTAKSSTNDVDFALYLWQKGEKGRFKWWDHQKMSQNERK